MKTHGTVLYGTVPYGTVWYRYVRTGSHAHFSLEQVALPVRTTVRYRTAQYLHLMEGAHYFLQSCMKTRLESRPAKGEQKLSSLVLFVCQEVTRLSQTYTICLFTKIYKGPSFQIFV